MHTGLFGFAVRFFLSILFRVSFECLLFFFALHRRLIFHGTNATKRQYEGHFTTNLAHLVDLNLQAC